MKPIIVIPTYNEKENIKALVTALFQLQIPHLELVIVDDNSPDGTWETVQQLSQQYPIYPVKRMRKLGIGTAYIAGFKKALAVGADVVFEMDADLSHDPKDVPRMIAALDQADVTIGSRKIRGGSIVGWGFIRKFMSTGAMLFARILLRLKTKDVTAGFRAMKRDVLESIDLGAIKSNGYAFQEELIYRIEKNGFRVVEIPVTFQDRSRGKSKLSKKDVLEFFLTIPKLLFQKTR